MRVSSRAVTVAMVLGAVSALLAGAGGAASPAGATAATASSPWTQTDYNAAQSRANLTEQTLTAPPWPR